MNRERRARNTQACAVCKHQRKRCSPDCVMARFFPASRYTEFQNAHKLFGMRNINKIMSSAPDRLKRETADSLLKEGNARVNDPVRGLQGVVRELQAQIDCCKAELEVINSLCEIERQKHLQKVRDGSSSSSMPPPPPPPPFEYGSRGFVNFQSPPLSSASCEAQLTMDPYQTGISGKEQDMDVAHGNNNEKHKSSSSKKARKPMGR